MLIRENDMVLVTTGDDAGAKAKVLRVLRKEGKVVLEGVNRAYKHVKRSQKNPQGGRLSMEMAIDWSNVKVICGACSQGTRVGARMESDGSKVRYCKQCEAVIGKISPPRKPSK